MTETNDTTPGSNGGEQTELEKSQAEDKIHQQLTDAATKTAQATLYARLMQDPDFATLHQAKAAGRKVKIAMADEPQVTSLADQLVPRTEEQVDLDKLDNKDLLSHFMRETAKIVEKVVDNKINPLSQQVQSLTGQAQQDGIKRAKSELEETRTKFPDFDKHLTRISELNQTNPSLNPFQLYSLAKAEAGEPIVMQRNISSERPGSTTGRPPVHKARKAPLAPGMMGLRQAIREAAQNRLSDGTVTGDLDDEE